MFAVQVGVTLAGPMVAGLQHHVDGEAEWIEKLHERLEEPLAGNGRHHHGDIAVALVVAIVVVPVALAGNHL